MLKVNNPRWHGSRCDGRRYAELDEYTVGFETYVQATGPDELFAIREADHHGQGRVRVEHLDRTARGFLLQFEERWVANGQHWYARASAR